MILQELRDVLRQHLVLQLKRNRQANTITVALFWENELYDEEIGLNTQSYDLLTEETVEL